MFRLAHLSDPHLGPLPPASYAELASKRALGYLNWHLHRSRHVMQGDSVARVLADIKAASPDHIAITGDLVNLGLPREIENARNWLDGIDTPDRVSIVPGNHDAYVPGAVEAALHAWAPFATGDGAAAPTFPYLRRRGAIAIIGVSSAIATGAFMATGLVDDAQADRLRTLLRETEAAGLCRVVLIHHLAIDGATKWKSRLLKPHIFRDVIRLAGADLILHGHTHTTTVNWLPGPFKPVPVVGVQGASLQPSNEKRGPGWNMFEIEGAPLAWRITHVDHGMALRSDRLSELSRALLAPPR